MPERCMRFVDPMHNVLRLSYLQAKTQLYSLTCNI